jgi:nitroreductase
MTPEFDLASTDRLLTTTRSVRKRLDFDRPVAVDVVMECMTIALQAATGGNAQRWRWVIVLDEGKRRAISALYSRSFREILDAPDDVSLDTARTETRYHHSFANRMDVENRLQSSVTYLIENIHRAPVLVLACVVGRAAPEDTPHWVSAQFGSVYPAVWNLQLALRSRGLGSCLTAAHLTYEREVATLLAIPHEEVMQVCLLPVAYYKGDTFRPAKRRPLNEVVGVDVFPAQGSGTW